jgi:hypothetical protein
MLRIGITIGLRHAGESMWTNGIKQTALFFAKLLKASPQRHEVTLVNTTPTPITGALPWDLRDYPTLPYESAKNKLDVLFVMGGAISQAWLRELQENGTKVVSFRLGSEYFVSMERMVFNQQTADSRPVHLSGFDQMWFIPQVWEANQPYLQVLHKLAPSQIKQVPFVWDPMFIETYLQDHPDQGEYRPRAGPRRLSCFEPNINVLKTFIFPLLIAEMVYREAPDSIEFMSVLGSQHFRNNEEFLGVIEHLDIVRKKGKCYFEDRHITPGFLAEHTDVVLSHQIYNPLNNLTLEVGWLGYPLVHNSPLCRDIGYYYEGFDVEAGAKLLSYAINEHDAHWQAYRDQNRDRIAKYLPTHPAQIQAYDALIAGLFN